MADDSHEAFEADFDDYNDHALPEARAREVEPHLASSARCKAEFERFRGTIGVLSGLHKMVAPPDLQDQVAETIHRRSAGRFFGRRAFGDRIPFELLAVVALAMM